jgi:hypothetical protein
LKNKNIPNEPITVIHKTAEPELLAAELLSIIAFPTDAIMRKDCLACLYSEKYRQAARNDPMWEGTPQWIVPGIASLKKEEIDETIAEFIRVLYDQRLPSATIIRNLLDREVYHKSHGGSRSSNVLEHTYTRHDVDSGEDEIVTRKISVSSLCDRTAHHLNSINNNNPELKDSKLVESSVRQRMWVPSKPVAPLIVFLNELMADYANFGNAGVTDLLDGEWAIRTLAQFDQTRAMIVDTPKKKWSGFPIEESELVKLQCVIG